MANATIQIPESHRAHLAELVRLPRDTMTKLIEALKTAAPTLYLRDLARTVAPRVGMDADHVTQLLRVISSLYMAMSSEGTQLSELIDDLRAAAKKTGKAELEFKDEEWANFSQSLPQLLSLDHSLGITSKALGIMLEHERVFCSARIVTEMRPVFRPDAAEGPAAAVITHAFRISFHENDDSIQQFFVAMDSGDLRKLRAAVDRALIKEKSLRRLCESSQVPCLNAEEGK